MDLKQALNDVARERAQNEQTKELEEDESVTIEFNPELDDVKFWIQKELQYSEGYISSDPETRRLQIEWSLKLLQINELQEISMELSYVNENLRNLNMTCKYGVN
ncbi:MAG TPA: hypothetical protein EYO81_04195 [Gammaproteobacteria bacterium]|nr:hypothetical protein [Gammaproteobacteria bacterium]